MGVIAALFLAVGLAMDAAAVCAARGLVARSITNADRKRVALYFGGSQALMPLVGWALARSIGVFATGWLSLVGGLLLAYLGVKMGRESFGADRDTVEHFANRGVDPLNPSVLMPLAFATSIDALAAGIVLDRFSLSPLIVASLIGVVTAALSVGALHLAKSVGQRLGNTAHLIGAAVLIGLGIRLVIGI